MNLVIDDLNVVTGWSASGGSTSIYGLNDHAQYIAGPNSKSLVFYFNGQDSYVTKSYSNIDVTNYDEFVMHIYSQQKTGTDFQKISQFNYKIEIGTGNEFYVPVYPGFNHIVLDISSITTIDLMTITALHDDEDYIISSYAVVATDEMPLDIFTGIQAGLEAYRDSLTAYNLGTVTGDAADTSLDLSDFDFIDDNAVILIDDGVNDEIHQLRRHDEGTFTMTDLYDGGSLVNTYSAADVYLYLPVEFGRDYKEAIIPGITIWGFEPAEILRTFNVQKIIDTWTATGPSERREGHYLSWPFILTGEARQNEILARLGLIMRAFIGRKVVYINGRKCRIDFNGAAVETRPTEHFDIIPQLAYNGVVEIREELWSRTSLPITTTINTPVVLQ